MRLTSGMYPAASGTSPMAAAVRDGDNRRIVPSPPPDSYFPMFGFVLFAIGTVLVGAIGALAVVLVAPAPTGPLWPFRVIEGGRLNPPLS